ncbi:MAG: RNA 2',3'-cyclic phosphodiesterase [Elusimicrobiales bacterium]|nr:RNA 2',3'-cyclic phosphodiesterase [Elusimicrobiales bacterium]
MRTFIALQTDDIAKKELSKFRSHISHIIKKGGIKLVDEENIHLTLFFLGEFFNENNISFFLNEFKNINFTKIPFKFKKIGFFPNETFPKIIWISPDDESSNNIMLVYNHIKDLLSLCGFEPKDSFTPHITLARIKENELLNKKDLEIVKSFSVEGNYFFTSLVLFKSELTFKGPIYNKIVEIDSK